MSESSMDVSDATLERALEDLGHHLDFPPAPDLSHAVASSLQARPRRGRQLRLSAVPRAALYPVLAALAILAAVLALSPAARSAVASWFHIPGVQIESGNLPPGPLGRRLDLGRRVSLSQAQKSVSFRVLIPTLPGLGPPQEVYAGTPPSNGSVSLVYRATRQMPRAATTGAGLLITEFRRPFFYGKRLPPGTAVQPVPVNGGFGIWLAGTPHYLYYVDQHGKVLRDTTRLAGNTLIWQRGGLTVRLEGKISQERALAIARSMRPATSP